MDERKLYNPGDTESLRIQKILAASARVHADRTEQKSLFNFVAEGFMPTPPTDAFGVAQDAMKTLITKKPPH